MNAKGKGTRNEHRSKMILEAAGYAVCRDGYSCGYSGGAVALASPERLG